MSLKNIGGSSDPTYRYKRPTLILKYEGKGNGKKTQLLNLEEIAKSLHVKSRWILKFIGIELGTQTRDKTLSGMHTQASLEALLEKFISYLVICPTCKLPEITLYKTTSSILWTICSACSHCDQTQPIHRIHDVILKDVGIKKHLVRDTKCQPTRRKLPMKKVEPHLILTRFCTEHPRASHVELVAEVDRQETEEDHAFTREMMEEATAGRYYETQQRMATAKAATEPKKAYDLKAPVAAKDIVRRELKVADISPQPAGTVSGVVRSADDLEPLPGAVVKLRYSEKGTVADMEGRFTLDVTTNDEETLEVSYIGMKPETVRATTDQPVEIALVPDEISLDEVVVIGYGSSKKSQLTASTTAEEVEPSGTVKFESAVPANGLADFRSYIDSTLAYPEPTETSGKEVVVLKFSVAPDGRPQNFLVIRAPDNEAFEKEAIRVVSEGPAWHPATRNGQHTEEEVRLRIVFRKD